ncbi:MFS transporter [Paenibacillus periandrae]|uniref:MFS transporter n=1 Tax=Paenibacillus periandrae TaxID=1761741 RepID=UPI001F09AA4B|nr:MFS transporter [Paenibacillus periandrae]
MLELLKDKTYIKYWLAVVIAFLGDGIVRIAVIYLMSHLTDDLLMLALVIFAQLVPSVLSVFVGPLTDRFPKRLIMICADLIRMILALCMIFITHSPWLLLLLVLLNGAAKSVFEPARIASVRRIVGNHSIPVAISLFQSTVQTINIVGPMLAGLLLVIDNPGIIFAISAGTYLCSALLIGNIGVLKEDQTLAQSQAKPAETYWSALKAGIQGTMGESSLRYLLILMIPVMVTLGIFTTNYNALLLQEFHAEAFHFGLLEALFGIGAIAGALIGPKLMRRYLGPGLLLQAAITLFGIALVIVQSLIFLREENGLLPVYVWCVITGLSQGLYNVPLSSTFLMKLPKELVGRGSALLFAIVNLCTIIGVVGGGWMAKQLGIPAALVYTGTALLIVAVCSCLMKGYRQLQTEYRQQKLAEHAAAGTTS